MLEEVTERTWPPADLQARPRQLETTHSFPCPWNVCFPHTLLAQVRAVFKDAALREQCIVETIWRVYVTKPCYSLHINFRILTGEYRDPLILWAPKTSFSCTFPCLLNLPLQIWSSLLLSSILLALRVRQPVYKATTGWPARRQKKQVLRKRHHWGKSQIGHQPLCGERWLIC